MNKKLIEVALPLEAINNAAAYEKMPGIGAHPRGLHLWWARRPFTVARAVIWASLVDDPSAHPELFPSEKEQNEERQRLFRLLERLSNWKNSESQEIMEQAKEELVKSTDNKLPALLDPFAGGGAIPLEAQRLGLEVYANDLNPIAVMINKAMVEIAPRFSNITPVNPKSRKIGVDGWQGPRGLAEDVRYYGNIMSVEANKQIGYLYPKAKDNSGEARTVVAWIWARTVASPNPLAHGAYVPLVSSFVLSSKKGHKAWVV